MLRNQIDNQRRAIKTTLLFDIVSLPAGTSNTAAMNDNMIKGVQQQLIKMSIKAATSALELANGLRTQQGPSAVVPSEDEIQAQNLLDGVPGLEKWISQQVGDTTQTLEFRFLYGSKSLIIVT